MAEHIQYVRYCSSNDWHYIPIYNTSNVKIGRGYSCTTHILENGQILCILHSEDGLYCRAYADLCNKQTYKCNNRNCRHTISGEVQLMSIKNIFPKQNYN